MHSKRRAKILIFLLLLVVAAIVGVTVLLRPRSGIIPGRFVEGEAQSAADARLGDQAGQVNPRAFLPGDWIGEERRDIMNFFSQQGEDLFIFLNYINKQCDDGVFIEMGACDGVRYSNTLFFQQQFSFTGILIEPVAEMYDMLIKNRKDCKCYKNVISNDNEPKKMIISKNGPVSGLKETMSESFLNHWHKNSIERVVESRKLSDILNENQITYVDFFSLDVEGGELDVLKSIDWNKVSFYIICIEMDNHNQTKNNACREILLNNGFKRVFKMCINEFWVNPSYFRKKKLFDETKKQVFSGNMNDYGNHLFLEKHCKSGIEEALLSINRNIIQNTTT